MKQVLHITNWYPNKWNDVEALFVKEQFDLFSEVTDSCLIHVQVRESEKLFKYEKVQYSDRETGYYILTKIKVFRIMEILTTFLFFLALFRSKANKFDLLHFHIAYPLLTYYSLWKKFIKTPLIISEHWSAYHFNFFMPKETKKLDRLKRIFHQALPVITVSKALRDDIQSFAGTKMFQTYVIPNVIDTNVYGYESERCKNDKPIFFIVNFWREIKNPFPMLRAFASMVKRNIDFELRIGGYGPILDEMTTFVHEQGLETKTVFLGKMYKEDIAREMNRADAYLFSSNYETFSAVCAQALCCGCPLIGPPLSAVREYAYDDEMVMLAKNDTENWESAVEQFIKKRDSFDRRRIAEKAQTLFSHERINRQYLDVINA